MKSSVETVDTNTVKLSVEVDEPTFEVALDEVFKKLAREVRIPGFRPGKAPRRVLEANIGLEFARAEAIQYAMPDYYSAAIRDNQIDAIAQPEIDLKGGEESGPLRFEAVVETRPEFEIKGYADIEVKIPNPVPPATLIESQIDMIRGRFADLLEVDRPATAGDTLTIDIVGEVDGEPLPGLSAEDYSYELGSGGIGLEFDGELEGARAGVDLSFITPHPVQDETEIFFEVTIHAVKEKVLPQLTEEWVDENTEFETESAMREDVEARLGAVARANAMRALRDSVASAAAELITEDIPESLINGEMNDQVQNLAYSLQIQDITMDEWLGHSGTTAEDFAEDLRVNSVTSARVDLALRAIAAAEDLDPTAEDLNGEFERIAEHLGETVEEIRQRLENRDGLMSLRADLTKRAALEWLVERVAIVDADTGDIIDRSTLESPATESTGTTEEASDEAVAQEEPE